MAKKSLNVGQLLFYCLMYFASYIVFGVSLKWLLSNAPGRPGMPGMEVLFNTTVGGMSVCLAVVLIFWWPGRLKSTQPRIFGGRLPGEYKWLIPSGICTGFVIPTTTLMYTFGYSVMVAMVLMRSSLIVSSRIVDAILIKQGHMTKKVYWQENAAVGAAIAAVSLVIFAAGPKDFQFFKSTAAMVTMALYIFPYSLRIYILNRFKTKADHKAIFGIEQIFAAATAILVLASVITAFKLGWQPVQVKELAVGFFDPSLIAILIGVPYGIGAFFSVFLYLFKGGTATFNTTLNRVTSLIAGTIATLAFYLFFDGKPVKTHQWGALAVVMVAIAFLTWAGKRRQKEVELEPDDSPDEQPMPLPSSSRPTT